jgi:hypothetical protein
MGQPALHGAKTDPERRSRTVMAVACASQATDLAQAAMPGCRCWAFAEAQMLAQLHCDRRMPGNCGPVK